MGYSIKSGEREKIRSIQNTARSAAMKLEEATSAYNDAVTNAFAALKEKVDAYNEAINDLAQECDEVASQLSEEYESHSEKWQESDKGDAFRSWMEEWEISFDEFDCDEPDEVDFNDSHSDQIWDLMPDFDCDY